MSQLATQPHGDVYCYCLHTMTCTKCGIPRTDRTATRDAIQQILNPTIPRPAQSNVAGNGPLLVSDIPNSAKTSPIILGIDEAGRGSVLGPMVYGLAYWSVDAIDRIPKSFNDSKQLSEEQRETLWKVILDHPDIGFALKALLPNEISRNMLRKAPYNLNEQSHDTAIAFIRKVQRHHTIQACFIDTVGNANHYKRKLEREFPGIAFTVESKADANYAPCSAASVVAKVTRDKMSESWRFSEPGLQDLCGTNFGSGYPSDPKCKAWLEHALQDKVFGYSDLVRFSWAPIKSRLNGDANNNNQNKKKNGTDTTANNSSRSTNGDEERTGIKVVPVLFQADLDEEELEQRRSQKGMSSFLGSSVSSKAKTTKHKKRKLATYFKKRKLHIVNAF